MTVWVLTKVQLVRGLEGQLHRSAAWPANNDGRDVLSNTQRHLPHTRPDMIQDKNSLNLNGYKYPQLVFSEEINFCLV